MVEPVEDITNNGGSRPICSMHDTYIYVGETLFKC